MADDPPPARGGGRRACPSATSAGPGGRAPPRATRPRTSLEQDRIARAVLASARRRAGASRGGPRSAVFASRGPCLRASLSSLPPLRRREPPPEVDQASSAIPTARRGFPVRRLDFAIRTLSPHRGAVVNQSRQVVRLAQAAMAIDQEEGMPVETTSLFATVIQEHLELRRRNAALEHEMPLEKYMPDDPFENHPLFKTEEQARVEDTMDGVASIVDEPTSLDWPARRGHVHRQAREARGDAETAAEPTPRTSPTKASGRARATSTGAISADRTGAGRLAVVSRPAAARSRAPRGSAPTAGWIPLDRSMPELKTWRRLLADRRPARGRSRRSRPGLDAGERYQTLLGATGTGQDGDDGLDHREGRPAGARDRAQQDARRAALQRVPRVLPARTPSSTSSPTTTTTSPRRTSRRPTSTSRRTARATTTSTGCATRRPRTCSPAATS